MSEDNILVACDVGTSKICVLVAEVALDESLKLIGFGQSIPQGIKKGNIVNMQSTTAAIEEAVKAAEKMADIEIQSIFTNISGAHIASLNNRAAISLGNTNREITPSDIRKVCEAARSVPIQPGREIIHSISNEFRVDDNDGIKDPSGMTGLKLETETHIVTGSSNILHNFKKCIEDTGLKVENFIFSPLASAEAVLTEDEKKLGVALVEIGAGTTDIAIFAHGNIVYSASISIGSEYVTKDLAVGLKTTEEEAEKVKISKGLAAVESVPENEKIEVKNVSKDGYNIFTRFEICSIIEARMEEIFTMVREKIVQSGYRDRIKGGIVLTGGGVLLGNSEKLCGRIISLPVRIGKPQNITGLSDTVKSPAYSASVGILKYALKNYTLEVEEVVESDAFSLFFKRISSWFGF